MKAEMMIHYDEEADFLEINLGKYTEGYFRDIAPGISERIDEKTGKVTGIAILNFRKRAGKDKNITVSFQLT